MSKNTQRTLKALRDEGRECGMVERFISQAGPHGKRIDLFNFIDIIALCPHHKAIAGVQSCGQAFKAHVDKILNECREKAILWLECGGRIQVYGWRKILKKRGGKQKVWKPRIREITLEDFMDSKNMNPSVLDMFKPEPKVFGPVGKRSYE